MSLRHFPTFVAWTLVVLASGAQELSAVHWGHGPRTWDSILLIQSATWSAWALLAVFVVRPLSRRLPLDGPNPTGRLLAHLAVATVLGVAACGIGAMVSGFYYYGTSTAAMRDMFRDRLHTVLASYILAYGALVAVLTLHRRPSAVSTYLRRLIARDDGRLLVVPQTAVDWIEANDDTVRIHAGGAVHTMRDTLTALGRRLDPARFARIHRSTIVNLDRVREIQPWFKGEQVLLLNDGTRLTIGPTYRDELLQRLHGDRA